MPSVLLNNAFNLQDFQMDISVWGRWIMLAALPTMHKHTCMYTHMCTYMHAHTVISLRSATDSIFYATGYRI